MANKAEHFADLGKLMAASILTTSMPTIAQEVSYLESIQAQDSDSTLSSLSLHAFAPSTDMDQEVEDFNVTIADLTSRNEWTKSDERLFSELLDKKAFEELTNLEEIEFDLLTNKRARLSLMLSARDIKAQFERDLALDKALKAIDAFVKSS